MKKSTMLFQSAPLIAGMCATTAGNAQSTTADAAYCQALAEKYATYVGAGANSRWRRGASDVDAGVAISECHDGNPGPAIPVLEQKLRDSRIDLRSRH
jgi:hypothetical protein